MLLGLGPQPDDREGGDAGQHGQRDEVLQEAQRVPPADERDVEVVDEQQAVRLEVDRGEDEEAPHREEVGEAGDRPFQQPGLPEHFLDLGGDASAEVVLAAALVAGFLTGPDQVR